MDGMHASQCRKMTETTEIVKKRERRSSDFKTKRSKSERSRKKERKVAAALEEEQRLTALLFGGPIEESSLIDNNQGSEDQEESNKDGDDLLFEIDREGDHRLDTAGRNIAQPIIHPFKSLASGAKEGGLEQAWIDEDDEVKVDLLETNRLRKLRKSRTEAGADALSGAEVEQRLRERYKNTTMRLAQTSWANVADDKVEKGGDAAAAENIEMSSEALVLNSTSSGRLPPSLIEMVRCTDANLSDPNNAVVQAVHFHPGSDPDQPLLLTAGLDKTLRFFQVGEESSTKIHGIHFPKLPIYSASFLGSTGNVVVSGRRAFFYIYDAVAGKLDFIPRIVGREEKSLEKSFASPDGRTIAFVGNDGYVILFDAQSKQWLADLKMNGSARAITFSPDGSYLLGSGSDGDVYKWDMRTRKCVERFSNEDGTITSYLAASSKHFAVGAESGVVNIYNASSSAENMRTPVKSIMNIRTSADMVRFNRDGQILAISSRREKNSLKLVHVPTASVFSNWPTSSTPLGYVWSLDFSPESKYFAVGNDRGKCLLYRLPHYHD